MFLKKVEACVIERESIGLDGVVNCLACSVRINVAGEIEKIVYSGTGWLATLKCKGDMCVGRKCQSAIDKSMRGFRFHYAVALL